MKKLVSFLILLLPFHNTLGQNAAITEETLSIETYMFSDPNPLPILTKDRKIYPYFKFEGYEHKSEELFISINALQELSSELRVLIGNKTVFQTKISLLPMGVFKKKIPLESVEELVVIVGNRKLYYEENQNQLIKLEELIRDKEGINDLVLAFYKNNDERLLSLKEENYIKENIWNIIEFLMSSNSYAQN